MFLKYKEKGYFFTVYWTSVCIFSSIIHDIYILEKLDSTELLTYLFIKWQTKIRFSNIPNSFSSKLKP